jgi:hypothetical protein
MKTRVIKLKNGDFEITLCGAIHVGTQNYFNNLNAKANESDVVLFEGIGATTLNKTKIIYKLLADLLQLTIQNRNGYENNPKWINSDLNYEILRYYMKNNPIEKINNKTDKFNEMFKDCDEEDRRILSVILKFLLNNILFLSAFAPKKNVLIVLRNYKVVVDITKQFETCNKVAVIYGEGHLNHLIKTFKNLNFNIVEKSYLESF